MRIGEAIALQYSDFISARGKLCNDAARMQARELARLEIAGSISSEATSLIDNMVGNKQLENEDAASMTTMLSESKTIFSQKLGRTTVAVEAFRVLPNKNREVLIRLAVKSADIKEIARNVMVNAGNVMGNCRKNVQ